MAERMRFAILSFAHLHAWSYARVLTELPEAELVAVYDDDKERLERAVRQYGVKAAYSDYRELLRREDVDAVIITSENARHAEMATAAAEAGKHILCEKPIATTLRDADAMLSAARRAGVKFQTAFVMRYHEATAHVKRLIDAGEIGRVLVITTTNHGKYPGGWFGDPELAGGGSVMDHVVHTADLMRWYTGSEASEVYAVIGEKIRAELPVEDCALLSVKFRDGTVGSIDCSWSRPDSWPIWGDVYLAIYGTEGHIVVNAFMTNIWVASEDRAFTWRYFGPDCDRDMIKDFIRVVREDLEPRATGWDGRQALEIALAAYESAKSGRPVKLPLLA